ncbi:YdeI/OmpD-associated family protein [Agromyces archimandritae]|uniref:YdeI/OmpD-associated family protein n=1 Tax=Agromyces archimandritae TaxID=2781962 RepID=A0A975FLJ4_9MICO|nr:YdeI/OmpD-associated family protein [Agromyces archimandritae]QTX03673.1 YdeI/OmpD-associated family protein [Agromyces archimandritae]
MTEEPEVLVVADRAAWRAWLDANEDASDGVWLLLVKKGKEAATSLAYVEAVEEALCSGWIDGQMKSIDDAVVRQRFTPRRRRSIWSLRNVDRVERLIAEGRMRERGHAEIALAKADGRWDRAYGASTLSEVPPDLAAALAASPAATETFGRLSGQNRYAVLHRVTTAATEPTRARRIERLVGMLARGETPYPQ